MRKVGASGSRRWRACPAHVCAAINRRARFSGEPASRPRSTFSPACAHAPSKILTESFSRLKNMCTGATPTSSGKKMAKCTRLLAGIEWSPTADDGLLLKVSASSVFLGNEKQGRQPMQVTLDRLRPRKGDASLGVMAQVVRSAKLSRFALQQVLNLLTPLPYLQTGGLRSEGGGFDGS